MEQENLSFLVVGLGSMGKRRIRNLQYLGCTKIAGFDIRQDRCEEARELYAVPVFNAFEAAIKETRPDALIISVPPDKHHIYIEWAFKHQTHFFVEASVLNTGYEEFIQREAQQKIVSAPSCTLCFHPAITTITEIIRAGHLGKLSSVLYHSGQYLPDWHSYEKVSDFYVSNKETGGAREILPFELTWITQTFGFPQRATGVYKKTIAIPGAPQIDDTYILLADYGDFVVNLTIDVVSRYATRRMTINGEQKQLVWDWEDASIRIFDPEANAWEVRTYHTMPSQLGYNKNITEQMYIDEMKSFIDAILGKKPFKNTFANDLKVLEILYATERSYDDQRSIPLPWTE